MSIADENPGSESGGQVRRRRRRRWSEAQKRQIVAETHEPGVSVPMVAQRYNLNANQIFRWRRLFRELECAAGAGRFVPVVVEAAPGQEPEAATTSSPSESVADVLDRIADLPQSRLHELLPWHRKVERQQALAA